MTPGRRDSWPERADLRGSGLDEDDAEDFNCAAGREGTENAGNLGLLERKPTTERTLLHEIA